MLISEIFGIGERAFISLIGAGGKSTLFQILADELSRKNKKMILTTTTHIFTGQLAPFFRAGEFVESNDEKVMEERIRRECFPPHIFSHLTGLAIGEKINIKAIISLINHPEGLFKNAPDASRCHFFINKVNNRPREEFAEQIIAQLLQNDKERIDDIIIGNTFQMDAPIFTVIKSKRK